MSTVEELTVRFAPVEGMDAETGVMNCGSADAFEEAIRVFYDTALSRALDIERFAKEGDLRSYTVRVHALKHAARLIGAISLSDDAFHLEEAGRNEDTAEIHAKTPKLLSDYRALHGSLTPVCGETGEDEKPEISGNDLEELYVMIRQCADDFDLDGLDGIVRRADMFRMPADERDRWLKVRSAITDADWNALEELL